MGLRPLCGLLWYGALLLTELPSARQKKRAMLFGTARCIEYSDSHPQHW